MDEGVNRKRKALELSECARACVYMCPAGFVQAETYSAGKWVIIRQATDRVFATVKITNASVLSIDFATIELAGYIKD